MKLDIVIATFNRAESLARLLRSIQNATIPPTVALRLIVVDNNSRDHTRASVQGMMSEWGGRLDYLFEPKQGKSFALNAGLAAARGDIVAMLDDDEEVDPQWPVVLERVFEDSQVGFASGPCLPRWDAPVPDWLPPDYPAIIGCVEAGEKTREFGKDYDGIMMGGNAIVRRSVLEQVGPYNTALGRTGSNLCGCEDAEFHARLLASGVRGFYFPDLVVHHHVPAERLTKKYYRRWCLHHGVTKAAFDTIRREPVPYLCGVPRYVVGKAVRASFYLAKAACTLSWNSSRTFSRELAIWDLSGFVYGKYLVTPTELDGKGA